MKLIITTFFAIALSIGVFAQQNDTMFVHSKQFIHEFATQDVDSVIFYRTQERMILPKDTIVRTDTVIQKADTIRLTDTIRITDTVYLNDTVSTFPGEVSFKTDSVWTITNGSVTQEWSDVVMASGCKKNDFDRGTSGNYKVDCRQNPGYGDLFSWEAVNQYKAQLCPNGWRVPTKEDFITLDTLLGGTGANGQGNTTLRDKYLNVWGGAYGGNCSSVSTLLDQGSHARYWSQSEYNAGLAYYLDFDTTGRVYPQDWYYKYLEFTLRCVRFKTDTVRNDTVSSFPGKVSFKTDSVWTITNGTITQEWSDVVMATGCKKNDFKGYENGNYLADCRQNPGYGDLFSWEAVNQYKAQLCPNDWRVPTKNDFIMLDTLLGGTGNYQNSNTTHRDKYLTVWGGAYGGYCNSDGALYYQASYAGYWSQSEGSNYGYSLTFASNGFVAPQGGSLKHTGFTLRCVRFKTDTVRNDTVSSFPGKVSFKTNSVWTIGSQEWSDVVMATGCKKNDFKGYENGNYLADCRQNPGYGDLFSWEAVNRYKAQLCPNGWRVPTKNDFITLDTLLGGTGNYQSSNTTHRDKYLNVWGGAYGGYCDSDGTLNAQGSYAGYWSQSEYGAGSAYYLLFVTHFYVNPQYSIIKNIGVTLRCVR